MTETLRTALDRLAALSVDGVNGYGIDTLPATLTRAELPALLVVPTTDTTRRWFGEGHSAFQASPFSAAAPSLVIGVTHLLLVRHADGGHGDPTPDLVALVDATLDALQLDPTLNGALIAPPHIAVEMGHQTYNGGRFIGCAFRHRWQLAVSA